MSCVPVANGLIWLAGWLAGRLGWGRALPGLGLAWAGLGWVGLGWLGLGLCPIPCLEPCPVVLGAVLGIKIAPDEFASVFTMVLNTCFKNLSFYDEMFAQKIKFT